MRITVVGAGPVGSTIARAWRAAGHDVVVGVRDPESPSHQGEHGDLVVTTVENALDQAEAVLIALPGPALPDFVLKYGSTLDGLLLIDATNRMGRVVLHQVPLLQHRLPNARIYRAFCSFSWEVFAEPLIAGEQADLPYCGPSHAGSGDRAAVEQLIAEVGLRPVWIGDLDMADTLDGVARLWSALAFNRGEGRRVALRVLSESL